MRPLTAASATKMPGQVVTRSSWPPAIGDRNRGNPGHQHQPGEEPSRGGAGCPIPDDRVGDYEAERASDALHQAQDHQDPDVGCQRAEQSATVYSVSPAISGRRRPSASLSGPASNCPTARPTRQAVTVS